MERKEDNSEFGVPNFSNKTAHERLEQLYALKERLMELTGQVSEEDQSLTPSQLNAGNGQQGNGKGRTFTKATEAGRAMSDPNERGYTSALMLGVISFVIEVCFLAIAFLLYR